MLPFLTELTVVLLLCKIISVGTQQNFSTSDFAQLPVLSGLISHKKYEGKYLFHH